VVYAPIHEYGGVIKAARAYRKVPGGPYLNIPASANKTKAGVMRYTAKDVFQMGGYIRRIGRRWGVMLGKQLMFTLHKEVTIPARLGFRDAVDAEIPTLLSELNRLSGNRIGEL